MTIDIVLPVAEKGGVENTIKMLIDHINEYHVSPDKWNIRVIQFVWDEVKWLDNSVSFTVFNTGKGNYDANKFAAQYAEYLLDNGSPDVILAVAWPMISFIVKKAINIANNSSIPVISWLHAPVEIYEQAGYGSYQHLALADAHFCISKYISDEIKNNLPESIIFNVRNPHNNISIPSEASITSAPSTERLNRLTFVGRVSKEKNLETVIKALSFSPNWQLDIIGTGDEDYVDTLRELAINHSVSDRITWHGWQSSPWSIATHCDFLILSSIYEGFPLVAIEALSHGIPIISTPVSGITELVIPDVTGYIYGQQDYSQLSDILNAISDQKLSGIDKTLCTHIAQKYEKYKSLEDMCAKLAELVHSSQSKEILNNQELYTEKISVIIPCYNAEKYIDECLNSVLSQNFPQDLLEIIVINDASTDNTLSILQEYELQYPDNILLINCEQNVGQGAARNIGIEYASGEYISFVDADDYVEKDFLRTLYHKAVLYNCDVVGCGYSKFVDHQKEAIIKPQMLYDMGNTQHKKKYIIEQGAENAVWRHIYKTSFLIDNNIFFPENVKMEDLAFSHFCMFLANRIFELDEPLYNYRITPSGIMRTLRKEEYFDVAHLQLETYTTLKDNNLLADVESEYEILCFAKSFYSPYTLMKQNGFSYDDLAAEIESTLTLFKKHFPNITSNPYFSQNLESLKEILPMLENV